MLNRLSLPRANKNPNDKNLLFAQVKIVAADGSRL